MNLKPKPDHIFVEAIVPKPSALLITPEQPIPASAYGTVVAVGSRVKEPTLGQKILFTPHGGNTLKKQGEGMTGPQMSVAADQVLLIMED